MGCFDNIVSIRGLCQTVDPQTFWLNDIGINDDEIESIITNDYSGVQDFIDQKSAFAIRQVQGQIYSALQPQFKASSILASSRIGFEADNKTLITQSGWVGVEVKMYNPASFVDFTISNLSLFTNFSGSVDVKVYDLKQGLLLGTLPVVCVAGQISTSYATLSISAPRNELHLFIGYDSDPDSIDSYQTLTHNGCSECTGFTFNNRFIRATGASTVSPFTSVSALTHTGGLSFNYAVSCNHYDWMCVHRQLLGLPFLYRTGMEIMSHALLLSINSRTMNITTLNKDVLIEKQNYYTGMYNETMKGVLNNMRVPDDINCFHCNSRVRPFTSLP